MIKFKFRLLVTILTISSNFLFAEDGYELWLRYNKISDNKILSYYQSNINEIIIDAETPTKNAILNELSLALQGMLGIDVPVSKTISKNGALVFINTETDNNIINEKIRNELEKLDEEGYLIQNMNLNNAECILIAAKSDVGLLYGAFHFIKLLQTNQKLDDIKFSENPKIKYRLLNHWDNLNRTSERGYAGFSIWDWHLLPDVIIPRYTDYARANASVGINGTVITNVNANAQVLTPQYLEKVKALAEVFRPYGIKIYLTARFSAPIELSGLKTADPSDLNVIEWWNNKIDEIYTYIPDFGGFLVKANSEGQPGPQNYGKNHADGANMFADALKNHGGIVIWRAFVYEFDKNEDRAKQANNEFAPLDGKFRENVLIQVKNGAIDFQPREPFHPLFGAMPKTPLMMEFQITQEYLGQATHLVYLAPLYKECLESDTYVKGEGSTVAKVIDGSLDKHVNTGMSGVANTGTDRNWCGHPFAQANWYAFGRLAWNYDLTSEEIADEWIRMTFTNNNDFVEPVKQMMLSSRETTVNYMTPIGLHHIMGWDHHYGPGPWVNIGRTDWTSLYYHNANSKGIGFNRTATGSNAISQYNEKVQDIFGSVEKCPEKYLLWFHHVEWNHRMNSGRTLWEELCYKYYNGVESVQNMEKTWNSLQNMIDSERFEHVKSLLKRQEKEAVMWRNACLLYFQTFSKLPIPDAYEQPGKPLEYYKNLDFRYAPGILKCQ